MPRLIDALPPLYADLLPELFRANIPEETKATCARCAMCEPAGRGDSPARAQVESVDGVSRFFRPDTKCCTFHPRLPNYLVGALLSDGRPELAEGRRRVSARIADRLGATPLWLRAPPAYDLLYAHARRSFGKAERLLCPYFSRETGGCTVWAYREAVCSTYFCQYVAGADGRTQWTEVKRFLTLVEVQLSRWAVWKLLPAFIGEGRDREDPAGRLLGPEELDGKGTPLPEHRALWREWTGREEDFYRECFRLVSALTARDLERMLGLDGELQLEVLRQRMREATEPKLPAVLRFNPDATVKWRPDGSVALGAYSENEALELPGVAYGLLVEFRGGGEPVVAVRERLRTKHGADLDEDVLLTLYRHRVLVDGGAPGAA